ncbi:hypothetical protein ABEB36_001550 [Hypothenemus hampei]|uniref:Uncharacterized protein n=1 Tax=Hypothenemus hampei TaxID=57062 RepID=A0ABD1FEZ9_HYPHA
MSICYKRVNFYDLCRLCAQNIQIYKIKIFEPEGVKHQLQLKIKKCLSINVREDDFLPKVVCLKCLKQLELCYAFREECSNSEAMLSSYFKNYRFTDEFKKSGKVYIKDTVKTDSTAQSIQGINSNPKNASPLKTSDLKVEAKTIDNTKNNSIKKLKVSNVASNSGIQLRAMKLPCTIDILNGALKKAVQQLPKEILNKVIVNSNGEVINMEPQDLSIMEQVPQLLNNISVIKNDILNKQEVVVQNKNSFVINQNVVKIDLTDEEEKDCGSMKYNAVPYFKNTQPNLNNPTVIFPVSQYQNNNDVFPQQTDVNIPSANPTFINVICSGTSESPAKSMSDNQALSINMDDLRSSDTFQQASIKKETKLKTKTSSLKGDEGSKNHLCEVCSKTFKRREHLYQHMKLHTGFRPYQCSECKKTFVRKEHLLRHMVLHSGERNFTCDICTKSFSRHDNLLKHIRTHNKDSTYTCESCEKVFMTKYYYESHRSEHGKCYLPPELRT